ncbi:uncharacterized protein PHACADRAFT_52934, partial [Phanerochaete carnosa HHB-10118-sp]
DWESRRLTHEQMASASFPIYETVQKMGDLVLIPPKSCHQVANKGGLTIKVAWSRMSLKSLYLAFHDELPVY